MINLLILLALLILSLYYADDIRSGVSALATVVSALAGAFLMLHIVAWSLQEHHHNLFVQKRNAFEMTLNNARENDRPLERAAITKKVADWNVELAERKYRNTIWAADPYIDDRINNLKPIE